MFGSIDNHIIYLLGLMLCNIQIVYNACTEMVVINIWIFRNNCNFTCFYVTTHLLKLCFWEIWEWIDFVLFAFA